LRLGKAVLQRAHQGLGIVAELDGAHAFVRRRDQDRTERAFADGEANDVAVTAAAELRRRHAEQTGRGGVETAVGVEAGAIDRLRDGVARREFLAHAFGPVAGNIGLRRHAGDRFEHAVEVEAAHAGRLCQVIERRRLLRLFDQPAHTGDHGCVRLGERSRVGPAAFAWPKSGTLGLGTGRMEHHVLSPRQARRARGPAIDAGRPHGVDKRAVGGTITPLHSSPAAVGIERGRR
jgi:hypothetical protein